MTCRYAIAGCPNEATVDIDGIPACRECAIQASIPAAPYRERREVERSADRRCLCGCGERVAGKWKQGHNMRPEKGKDPR